jgi:hypothetical protein
LARNDYDGLWSAANEAQRSELLLLSEDPEAFMTPLSTRQIFKGKDLLIGPLGDSERGVVELTRLLRQARLSPMEHLPIFRAVLRGRRSEMLGIVVIVAEQPDAHDLDECSDIVLTHASFVDFAIEMIVRRAAANLLGRQVVLCGDAECEGPGEGPLKWDINSVSAPERDDVGDADGTDSVGPLASSEQETEGTSDGEQTDECILGDQVGASEGDRAAKYGQWDSEEVDDGDIRHRLPREGVTPASAASAAARERAETGCFGPFRPRMPFCWRGAVVLLDDGHPCAAPEELCVDNEALGVEEEAQHGASSGKHPNPQA